MRQRYILLEVNILQLLPSLISMLEVILFIFQNVLPNYVGWHLNEADSCMLGLCAHALLEDLLKTFPEFCSDFRNFTQTETIAG